MAVGDHAVGMEFVMEMDMVCVATSNGEILTCSVQTLEVSYYWCRYPVCVCVCVCSRVMCQFVYVYAAKESTSFVPYCLKKSCLVHLSVGIIYGR